MNYFKFIQVQGEKAASFLQGQLTCDIREVNSNQTRLAAYCNHKGRVLASLRVLDFNGDFYLELPESMADFTSKQLQKIALLSRVSLKLAELTSLNCYISEINNLPEITDQALIFQNVLIIRAPGTKPRYEIIGHPADLESIHKEWCDKIELIDNEHCRYLDIENGLPWIYPETQDLFTPHMLNFPQLNAVSFSKGCYVGQEVIARTHYLGATKRQLLNITLKAPQSPKPGDKIYNEAMQEIGIVVNVAMGAINQYQLLAVCRI